MATLLQSGISASRHKPPESVGRCLRLQCPVCRKELEQALGREDDSLLGCSGCGFAVTKREGIWKFLPPESEAKFGRFIGDYQTIRQREGRGSASGHYYRALPFKDTTGGNEWQWRIRAGSFRHFSSEILADLERRNPGGLDILDLGAGNCWLSYRLALRGHRPVAVDLLVNRQDGLGAAAHYFSFLPRGFPRFQAEMDRLPFAARQFDVAIFNASWHYSEDYERTLAETLRCLRRPGYVAVMDSPYYYRQESGQRMVEERHAEFEKKHGCRSDSIPSLEYLTPRDLERLARSHGITWRVLKPWYGIGWALRPARAWLLRRREPAKFFIFWGKVE